MLHYEVMPDIRFPNVIIVTGERPLLHFDLLAISRVLPIVPKIRLSCILCAWFPLRRSEDKSVDITETGISDNFCVAQGDVLKYLNNLRVQDRYLLDLAVLPFLINERSVNSGSGGRYDFRWAQGDVLK